MRRLLQYIAIFLIFFGENVFAANIPFTDVQPNDSYYKAVVTLFENWVISDDGTHLFHPNEAMSRDFYVALSVAVGCKKCETPSMEDVMRYQNPPFVDLTKENPRYYCIAYAKEANITQGYIPDATGKAYCENGIWYTTPPFCTENKISRIEGAAILLRRANLWNDTLNASNTDTSMNIPDVTQYWYGYAKKWVEAWFLTQWTDGSIKPDEKITRGEFAMMAEKTLAYTQCNLNATSNTTESAIAIYDSNGKQTNSSSFATSEIFSLRAITSSWAWEYSWTAINPSTGEQINWNWDTLPSSTLSDGSWIIRLDVINPANKKVQSTSYSTINIGNTPGSYNGAIIIRDTNGSVKNESTFALGSPLVLSPKNPQTGYSYSWEIKNDMTGNTQYWTWENYSPSNLWEWNWTISLITKDSNGNIIKTIIRHISISGSTPSNINNTSALPPSVNIQAKPISPSLWSAVTFTGIINWGSNSVQYSWDFWDWSKSYNGPSIWHSYTSPGIYIVTLTVFDPTTGLSSQSQVVLHVGWEKDSDNDGITDINDLCPLVLGDASNKWCPTIKVWSSSTQWPISSLLGNNSCLIGKQVSSWVMIGTVSCNICPCQNTATILAPIRSCDVLFPTILSPDTTKVYSRWSFYIVP